MLHNWNRKSIVNEDLKNLTILAANEQTLSFGGSTQWLHILDIGLKHPFSLENTGKCEQLDLFLKAENQMVGEDKEVLAVNLLVDLFVRLVFHVIRIVWRHAIDDDLAIELHGESILVDGDLLDVVSAPDLHSGLSNQVLDDHIGHKLSVGVSLLI